MGTVRQNYSKDGNAWDYFSHGQTRSRTYHWGEDGLAGIRPVPIFIPMARRYALGKMIQPKSNLAIWERLGTL